MSRLLLGSMRTGAQQGVVEEAIARAFSANVAQVRRAIGLVADPGPVRSSRVTGASRPWSSRLVGPSPGCSPRPSRRSRRLSNPALFVIEDKIDGVRVQAHRRERPDGGGDPEVTLFARGMERVTAAFPEVVQEDRTTKAHFPA